MNSLMWNRSGKWRAHREDRRKERRDTMLQKENGKMKSVLEQECKDSE